MNGPEPDYRDVPPAEASKLLNAGGVVLVCTAGLDGRYDVAPVAWNCPLDYERVSRLLVVLDPGHATFSNLEASREFALALPTWMQKDLVNAAGSVSARDVDKYRAFAIASSRGKAVDAFIPDGVAGALECRVIDISRIGSVAVVSGEVLRAFAVPDAWKMRLHHAEGDIFFRPGERI